MFFRGPGRTACRNRAFKSLMNVGDGEKRLCAGRGVVGDHSPARWAADKSISGQHGILAGLPLQHGGRVLYAGDPAAITLHHHVHVADKEGARS